MSFNRGGGETTIAEIAHGLERVDLLPAIVFRTSRAQCDTDVQRADSVKSLRLDPAAQREIQLRVKEVINKYEMDPLLITEHAHYPALISSGIGAHHAGQLLMWRLMLEELMSSGQLRILVATGTVAAGVDFPARTVVITAHSRRGSEGFRTLSSSEFQQMSGRAGRRGKDKVGFCVASPSRFNDARAVLKISKRPPEPLVSAYYPSPSTVLNLLRYRNADDLRYTVERSFAAFMDRREAKVIRRTVEGDLKRLPAEAADKLKDEGIDADVQFLVNGNDEKKTLKRIRRTYRQAADLEKRQVALLDATLGALSHLGYVEGVNLSQKGFWAANLCTTLVLELAEVIEAGVFKAASAERVAIIVASLSGDEHREYLSSKETIISKDEREILESALSRVADVEMSGVKETRKVLDDAAYTVKVWMQTENWQSFRSLLALMNVAEGDAARVITQTADQLSQLARLQTTHPELALRAEEAKRRLLRPPLSDARAVEI